MGMAKVIGSVLFSKYSYASKCKGWDEIRPLSGAGHNFWGGLGMMVVESLDTLYIMNLQDEYKEARDWIVSSLNLDINHFTSVFETTIRLLGGLPRVQGPLRRPRGAASSQPHRRTPLCPRSLLSSLAGQRESPNRRDADGRFASVSLRGGHELFGAELSLRDLRRSLLRPGSRAHHGGSASHASTAGTAPSPSKGRAAGCHAQYSSHGEASGRTYGMGNRGDSYYEYLLKGWMLTGDKALREEYCSSLEGLYALLLTQSGRDGLSVVTDYHGSRQRNMHHLACFLPGMLMLGVANDACPNQQRDRETAFKLMHVPECLLSPAGPPVWPCTIPRRRVCQATNIKLCSKRKRSKSRNVPRRAGRT